MKIGNKIQIGGIYWHIIRKPDLKDPETGEEITHGYRDLYKSEICINSDREIQQQFQTLLHEIKHCIRDSLGFHGGEEVDPQNEGYIEAECSLDHQVILQIIEWQKQDEIVPADYLHIIGAKP
jgi:hypothetical protein